MTLLLPGISEGAQKFNPFTGRPDFTGTASVSGGIQPSIQNPATGFFNMNGFGIGNSSSVAIVYNNNNYEQGLTIRNTNAGTTALTGATLNQLSGASVGQFVWVPANYADASLAGSILFSSIGAVKLAFVSAADNTANPDIYFKSGNQPTLLYLNGTRNAVGILTTTPSSLLDIRGGSVTIAGTNSGLTIPALASKATIGTDAGGNFVAGTGGGGGDNLGSHVSTAPLILPFMVDASSGIFSSSVTIRGPIISTSSALLGGATIQSNLVIESIGTTARPTLKLGTDVDSGWFAANSGQQWIYSSNNANQMTLGINLMSIASGVQSQFDIGSITAPGIAWRTGTNNGWFGEGGPISTVKYSFVSNERMGFWTGGQMSLGQWGGGLTTPLKTPPAGIFVTTTPAGFSGFPLFAVGSSSEVFFQVNRSSVGVYVPFHVSTSASFGIATTSNSYTMIVSSTSDFYNFAVSSRGYHTTHGAVPSLSSCGTSTINDHADNMHGTVAVAGVVTACTVNFGTPFVNAPSCQVSDNSTTIAPAVTTRTNSAVTFGFSLSLNGGEFSYHCDSND